MKEDAKRGDRNKKRIFLLRLLLLSRWYFSVFSQPLEEEREKR